MNKTQSFFFVAVLYFLSQTGIWINRSKSLEGKVFFVFKGTPKRGDFIAFMRGKKRLIKKVVGVPLDPITVEDGHVVVQNQRFLVEKGHAPLTRGKGYFVVGTHPRSFDSRYEAFGLVQSFVGKAVRLL